MLLQRQMQFRDLELRQLMSGQQQQQQQSQQLFAALTNQHQLQQDQLLQQHIQQLTQPPQTSALLQQQRLLELQQLANPTNGSLLSSLLSGNDGGSGGGGVSTGVGTCTTTATGTGDGTCNDSASDLLSQAIQQEMLVQQHQQSTQAHHQTLLQAQNQAQQQSAPVDAAHLQLEQRLAQASQRIQIQHGQQPTPYSAPTDIPQSPPPTAQTQNRGEANGPPPKRRKKEAVEKKETQESEVIVLDDDVDDPSGPKHPRKDIAMLLKATADPSVKDFDHYRQELAHEANEKSAKGSDLSVLAHEAVKIPPQDEADTPGSYKRIISVLPKLPSEPNLPGSDDKSSITEVEPQSASPRRRKHHIFDKAKNTTSRDKILELSAALQNSNGEYQDPTVPHFISQREEEAGPLVITCKSSVDSWWPSNNAIRKERRAKDPNMGDEEDDKPDPAKNGLFARRSKKTFRAIQSRLDDIEPGVLQKMPHCKLHRHSSRKEAKTKGATVVTRTTDPMFCVQVTEALCTDVMLCCSICSTWRHAQCGGHYTYTTPKGRPNTPFRPVCDRCYEDSKLLKDNPIAQGRIARQRNEHLRRSLASTSVLRHACFSKHSGQYKWPLGHVAPTHIDSHLRSVHTRHDRAEKQWRDAATKFGAKESITKKPKDNAKFRTKEFERLLGYVTDAEASTDLHNMILFLQRDSTRDIPAGFEDTASNFFDPDTPGVGDDDDPEGSSDNKDKDKDKDKDKEGKGKPKVPTCSRAGCDKRARFDSMFCSDGCGVSVAESDILKSMELASATLHPSALSRCIQYT